MWLTGLAGLLDWWGPNHGAERSGKFVVVWGRSDPRYARRDEFAESSLAGKRRELVPRGLLRMPRP